MKTKGMEGSKMGEEDISKFKFDLGSKVRAMQVCGEGREYALPASRGIRVGLGAPCLRV